MSINLDLPKSVREFIARDLVYVVGGGIVITSFLYGFNHFPKCEIHVVFTLLGIGMSYVIGFTIQEIFSIIRLVTTAQVKKPNRLLKWLYNRCENRPWKDLPDCSFDDIGPALKSFLDNDLSRAHYERQISHIILGATLGPCMLIASLFVFVKGCINPNFFDFGIFLFSLPLVVCLITICWLKAMQITIIDVKAVTEPKNK